MSAPQTTRAAAVPAPRPAADETQRRPRRVRPPNQYWDVFSASWVRSDGGAGVSRGAGEGG